MIATQFACHLLVKLKSFLFNHSVTWLCSSSPRTMPFAFLALEAFAFSHFARQIPRSQSATAWSETLGLAPGLFAAFYFLTHLVGTTPTIDRC